MLKGIGMKGGKIEFQWQQKQKKIDDAGDGRDEYLELFRNGGLLAFVEEFLKRCASNRYGAARSEWLIALLPPANV